MSKRHINGICLQFLTLVQYNECVFAISLVSSILAQPRKPQEENKSSIDISDFNWLQCFIRHQYTNKYQLEIEWALDQVVKGLNATKLCR